MKQRVTGRQHLKIIALYNVFETFTGEPKKQLPNTGGSDRKSACEREVQEQQAQVFTRKSGSKPAQHAKEATLSGQHVNTETKDNRTQVAK